MSAESNEASVQSVVLPMSLEQAWRYVKALWPNATRLERHDGEQMACWKDSTIIVGPMFFYRINPGIVLWPSGVTAYPVQQSNDRSGNAKEFNNPANADDYTHMHDYFDRK